MPGSCRPSPSGRSPPAPTGSSSRSGTERSRPRGDHDRISTPWTVMAELRPIARAVGRRIDRSRIGVEDGERSRPTPTDILHRTDRTLAQRSNRCIGLPPDLDVVAQWRLDGDASGLALAAASRRFARPRPVHRIPQGRFASRTTCRTSTWSDRSDVAAGLETGRVNLGQLFIDPGSRSTDFEFGTTRTPRTDRAEFRPTVRRRAADLHPSSGGGTRGDRRHGLASS